MTNHTSEQHFHYSYEHAIFNNIYTRCLNARNEIPMFLSGYLGKYKNKWFSV